ncbi:MAG: nuclear transport factor 2 family protein [Acidobacteria bacterium]|nr:nuclear transport factor 2 family protein [Acidobacteriota bacterium]
MKYWCFVMVSLILLSVGFDPTGRAAVDPAHDPVGQEAEKERIRDVLVKLDTALQTENLELLAEVFAHDRDLVIIGPDFRERVIGWEALAQMQQQQFRILEQLSISSKDLFITIDPSGNSARYVRTNEASFVSNALPFRLQGIRETGLLEKVNDRWVIVQQHASAPVSDEIWPFYFAQAVQPSTPFDIRRRFTTPQLQEDFDLLQRALEQAHAGLYRYTPAPEFDALFRELFVKIDGEMTEIEFFRLLAPVIGRIGCVHTEMRPSASYEQACSDRGEYLPFDVALRAGRTYVTRCAHPDNPLPPGSEILAINGQPLEILISRLLQMLPADGHTVTYQYRLLERSFPEKYFLYIHQPSSFKITCRLPDQEESTLVTMTGVPLKAIRDQRPSYDDLYREGLKLEIMDDAATALLTIRTFVPRIIQQFGYDFDDFLASSFTELRKRNVRNLILDLRGNDGGESRYCTHLLACLLDKPFRFLERVDTPNIRYSFLEYTDKGLFFNYLHPRLWTRNADGRYRLRGNWGRTYDPKPYNFQGHVYVLMNGISISASADVAALLHAHGRAVFIGEETGGGYFGNNSGDYLNLTLPHTGIRFRIPIRSSVLAVADYPHTDRGVLPDHAVETGIEDILRGTDRELEFALDLIREGKVTD